MFANFWLIHVKILLHHFLLNKICDLKPVVHACFAVPSELPRVNASESTINPAESEVYEQVGSFSILRKMWIFDILSSHFNLDLRLDVWWITCPHASLFDIIYLLSKLNNFFKVVVLHYKYNCSTSERRSFKLWSTCMDVARLRKGVTVPNWILQLHFLMLKNYVCRIFPFEGSSISHSCSCGAVFTGMPQKLLYKWFYDIIPDCLS